MIRDMLTPALERLEACLVETILSPEAQAQYAQGAIAKSELTPYAEAIKEMSAEYVEHRALRSLSKVHAEAYALYYVPINFAKLLRLLIELPSEFRTRPLRILDYGCGPGTGTLCAAEACQGPLLITAYDKSDSMLAVAEKIAAQFYPDNDRLKLEFTNSSPSLETERYDLIIAANVLNELPAEKQKALAVKLGRSLTDTGALVFLEPALKPATQNLMRTRNALLEKVESLSVLFPCTRNDRCPMLVEAPDQWCHGTLKWEETQLTRQIDTLTGFNKHRLKYSALVCGKNLPAMSGMRVVNVAKKSRLGSSALLCGENVFGAFLLPRRNRSDSNHDFDALETYKRVDLSPAQGPGEIPAQTLVKVRS